MASQQKGHKWFAAFFDRMMAPAERSYLKDVRQHVAGQAKGRVLEIGCGTGANFSFYTDAATEIVASEPDPHMLERARAKLSGASRPIQLQQAPAEELPFEDSAFDTVVGTINMCTMGDLPRALAEIRRVLRPAGELRFYEHVRYQNRPGAFAQDLVTPAWKWFGAGCHPNRDVTRAIVDAGFDFAELQRVHHGPPLPPLIFTRPHIMGVAVHRP